MLSALKAANEDTAAVKLMNEISYYYRNKQPDTGLYYAKRAMALAEKISWKTGVAKSYNNIGNNYYFQADPTNAMQAYQNALGLYEQLHDLSGITWSTNYIGNVYMFLLSDYLKALEYYERALKSFVS